VLRLVLTARVEEVVVVGLGLKAALDRLGRPLTLRLTAPVKPLSLLIVIA
jgi:hypothetical protein